MGPTQVVHFKQGLYKEDVYISTSKRNMDNLAEQCDSSKLQSNHGWGFEDYIQILSLTVAKTTSLMRSWTRLRRSIGMRCFSSVACYFILQCRGGFRRSREEQSDDEEMNRRRLTWNVKITLEFNSIGHGIGNGGPFVGNSL